MKIQLVRTKNFKDKYYFVKDVILEDGYFSENYPKLYSKAIKKLAVKPSYYKEEIHLKAFPSIEKMLEMVEKKGKEIIKKLNFNQIKGENADVVKTALLFDYLARKNMYDMTSQEETDVNYEESDKLHIILKVKQNKIKTLKNQLQKEQDEEKLKVLKERFKKEQAKLEQAKENFKTQLIQEENNEVLRKLFNVLFYNKGTCNEFSYAATFVMGLDNIDLYYLEIFEGEEESGHSINLLMKGKEPNETYYVADLTDCIAEAKTNKNNSLKSFIVPANKYFKYYKDLKIEAMELVKHSKNLYKQGYLRGFVSKKELKEIRGKISDKNPFTEEINYAKQLIKNNYEVEETLTK